MFARRNRDEFGSHTRRPHVMTGLYFLERLIVVDMLWPVVKIDNDFGIAIGQKTVDRMIRMIAFVIDKMIDKLIEWKPRDVSLKNHCQNLDCNFDGRQSEAIDIIIQLTIMRQGSSVFVPVHFLIAPAGRTRSLARASPVL